MHEQPRESDVVMEIHREIPPENLPQNLHLHMFQQIDDKPHYDDDEERHHRQDSTDLRQALGIIAQAKEVDDL